MMGRYTFIPYKSEYFGLFNKEKERIRSVINDARIEHVGSTAVVGLGGKGVIDIYIAVKREEMTKTSQLLQSNLGYVFKPEAGIAGERLFHNRKIMGEDGNLLQEFHVHVSYSQASDFKNALIFRDYLKAHPNDAQRYGEAKKIATREGNTKDEYMKIKSPIISEILERALKEAAV